MLPSHKAHYRKPSTHALSSSTSSLVPNGGDGTRRRPSLGRRRLPSPLRSCLRTWAPRSAFQKLLLVLAVLFVASLWLGAPTEEERRANRGMEWRRRKARELGRAPGSEGLLADKHEQPKPTHRWKDKFGVVEVNGDVKEEGRHVLEMVIERAERQWNEILEAQPRTLNQAHKSYKGNFLRRSPTKGYKRLFSRYLSDLASSPADSAVDTLSPFLPPTPLQMYLSSLGKNLRVRQAALEASNYTSPLLEPYGPVSPDPLETPDTDSDLDSPMRTGAGTTKGRPLKGGARFVFSVSRGHITAEFPWGVRPGSRDRENAERFVGLMRAVEEEVAGGVFPDLRITVNLELDVPGHVIPYQLAENRLDAARLLEFEDPNDNENWPLYTWHQTCEDFTPFRRKPSSPTSTSPSLPASPPPSSADLALTSQDPTFVINQLAYSPCMHPTLMGLNPTLASPPPRRDPKPVPRLAFYKTPLSSEILIPDLFSSHSTTRPKHIPWADKADSSGIVWRGSAPRFPVPYTPPARNTTLSNLSPNGAGKRRQPKGGKAPTEDEPAQKESLKFAPPPEWEDGEVSFFSPVNASMASAYRALLLHQDEADGSGVQEGAGRGWKGVVDARLAHGERVHCDLGQEGCKELIRDVPVAEEGYVLGSARYVLVLEGEDPTDHMLAGSLIFHASTLEAAWMARAVAWVHYIPLSPFSFSPSAPQSSQLPAILAFLRAHPSVPQKIAAAGRRFAERNLSERARVLGVAGVLVEYGRGWSEKRGAEVWDLEGDGTGEKGWRG